MGRTLGQLSQDVEVTNHLSDGFRSSWTSLFSTSIKQRQVETCNPLLWVSFCTKGGVGKRLDE